MSAVAHEHPAGDGHPVAYGDTVERMHRRQWQAAMMLLVADGVVVTMILFSYFYLRGLNTMHGWLPSHTRTVPLGLTWTIIVLAVLTAIVVRWAERGAARERLARLRPAFGIAVLLVLAAAVLQVVQLATLPFGTRGGAYASVYYLMSGYTVFHLVVVLFLLVGVFARASIGIYADVARRNEARLVAMATTWVGITGVLFGLALFFTRVSPGT